MSITIKPISAILEKDLDTFSKMDPYVKIAIGVHKYKTSVHKGGGKNPYWSDIFQITASQLTSDTLMKVQVYDQDLIKDDFLGEGYYDLKQILSMPGKTQNQYVDISKHGSKCGRVMFSMAYQSEKTNQPQGYNSNQMVYNQPKNPISAQNSFWNQGTYLNQNVLPQTNFYPQTNYSQNNYPQSNYPQSNYPQNNYPQSNYPQSNYPQSNYPQNNYPQNNYPSQTNSYTPQSQTNSPPQMNNSPQNNGWNTNPNSQYQNLVNNLNSPQHTHSNVWNQLKPLVGGGLIIGGSIDKLANQSNSNVPNQNQSWTNNQNNRGLQNNGW